MDNRNTKLWDLIDAVLVINLDDRPERWSQLLVETEDFVPEGKIHRIPAIRGADLTGYGVRPWFRGRKRDATWAARGGCVLSHRKALETARDAGWGMVLVLEDDVTFTAALREISERLGSALASCEWDLCYLGYTDPSPPWSNSASLGSDRFLARVFGCNCAHAYILKSEARDWILRHMPDSSGIWPWLAHHRAVDRWYLRTIGRFFPVVATSPSLINQTAGFSDILVRRTNYLEEGNHATAIPSDAPPIYPILSHWIRCQKFRISSIYDYLRAVVKRAHGF